MSQQVRWAALVAMLVTSAALAAGGGGGRSGPQADEMHAQAGYRQAVAAIEAQRFPEAIELLERHVWRYDRDADGHNWLAYAYRKSGKLDEAFKHYKRALAIEPSHLGAHEYLGEAYLMAGKVAEAQEQLKILAGLCAARCEQYQDLAKAIEQRQVSASAVK
jgi:tetratricopeptide (TPR) repeat protein